MEEIIKSLHILRLINNFIKELWALLNKVPQSDDQTNQILFLSVKSLIIILTKSYLDEWDNFLGVSARDPYKQQILYNKKIAKPAIQRIKKWTGITEFRNTVLAHNFRNSKKQNETIFSSDDADNLIVPENITELNLLVSLINLSTELGCKTFEEELNKTRNDFFKDRGTLKPRVINLESEYNSVVDEIMKIINP